MIFATTLAASLSSQGVVVIDAFADPTTFSISSSNATADSDTQMDPAILGGQRIATVVRDGGFGGAITASKTAGGGVVSVTNATIATGVLTLTYNGFSNLDLSGENAFEVTLPLLENSFAAGDGELDLSVTVVSVGGTDTVLVDAGGVPGRIEDPGTFIIAFSDFSGVDFSDVSELTFTFDSAIIGTVFDVSSLRAIPEPGTVAFGLIGLSFLFKRRR